MQITAGPMALVYLGNYSQANQILKQDPTDLAQTMKGITLLYLGKNNEALTIFNMLIAQA